MELVVMAGPFRRERHRRTERLAAPGDILPFSSDLSPDESTLSWRLAPRNAHGFASHGTRRNVFVDGQSGGPRTGLSAAQVGGCFRGATALGLKGGTPAAPLAEWLNVNDHKRDEAIDRSGKRNST
jgi:hypothetical protein